MQNEHAHNIELHKSQTMPLATGIYTRQCAPLHYGAVVKPLRGYGNERWKLGVEIQSYYKTVAIIYNMHRRTMKC